MELTKEQEKVLQSQVKDLVVSASAGSGKTFVVIEKLIGLICDKKVPVERLLVLTFTKAASNEMRNRLYNAILAKPSSKFLIEQIDSLPLADISTIDSFCEKIIKRNINKLDLDENFNILDEKTSKNLKRLAFSRAFQYFSHNESEKFEEIYFAFKRNKASVEGCVLSLQEFLASCKNQEQLLSNFENNIDEYNKLAQDFLINKIKNSFSKADVFLKQLNFDELNKNSQNIYLKLKEFTIQDFNSDIFTLSQNINKLLPFPAFRGKIEEGDKKVLNEARDLLKEGVKITENYPYVPEEVKAKIEKGDLIKALIAFYRHYIKLYNALKGKRDGLDFADIEFYAMQLLGDEEIKQGLQEKYDYIFIDEYQDTNRLQQSILKPISEGGYFVAVGDLKQGIYGFRNARMEIMQEDIENFTQRDDADALFLTGNFRTDKNILEFVNTIFEKVMTLESVGIDYVKTSKLQGLKHFEEGKMPAVAVDVVVNRTEKQEKEDLQPIIYSVKEDVLKEDERFTNEILAIQNRIEQALESEIYDAKKEKFRKVNYNDITLLFRNRSQLMKETYKHLCKKGIPVNADIKETLLEDGEIAAIYSLLKLSLNLRDDISLVSVMNSHFGGFTFEELADLRLEWNEKGERKQFYEIIEESRNEKVVNFRAEVDEFKFNVQIFGILKSLNKLFNKYDYYSYLQSLPNFYEKVGNINSLFKLIRSGNLDANVSGVISQLEGVQENAGGGSGNAIAMTTIHATKGLEYPIVIICGAGESLSKPYIKNFVISEKFGFASNVNDFENMLQIPSLAFVAGKVEKQAREFIDEIMIFYVAMTRAQNHLFVIGSGKEKDFSFDNLKNQNTYLKMIFFSLGENLTSQIFSQEFLIKGKWEFNVFDQFENIPFIEQKTEKENADFAEHIKEYQNFVYPNKDYCKLSFKNSVTGAIKLNEEQEIIPYTTEESETDNKVQIAIDRGNAYHEALKLLDFEKINSKDDLILEIEKIKENMTEGYLQLIDLQVLYKNISLIKNLTTGKKLYKEKEFIMQCSLKEIGFIDEKVQYDDNVIVQGIVDLFAFGDEVVLIDYKFSTLSPAALRDRYRKQIDLYSKALEKTFGKKIEKRFLLSLKNSQLIKM